MYQISIEENIKRILTTTKGSVPLNADFGLKRDYIDKPLSQDLIIALKEEILKQIATYEPRVQNKDISIESSHSSLTLHIENLAIELS